MKRLLVIGNSQVGALKNGYENIQDRNFNAQFWSIPGGGGPTLRFDRSGHLLGCEDVISDCLCENTDSLCLNDYDLILLSGVGMPEGQGGNIAIQVNQTFVVFFHSSQSHHHR